MILRCFLAWWILTFNTVSLQSKQYALPGQMVTFEPVITTPPDEILWKHNGNKVVEFNGNEETVYHPFEKRATLDWHAAVLEIKQLRHDDSGKYELDVLTNKGLSRFHFELEVIDRVAKPSISCKMNNGSSGSDKSVNEATLMCSADSSESQSLMFEWSPRGKIHLGPILKILVGKEYDDEVYSCTVSNRLSKEMATFTAKECYLVNRSAGLSDGVSATIGLIVVLCVLGALGVVYCKLKHKACFAKEKTKDVEQQSSQADDYTSEPLLNTSSTNHVGMRKGIVKSYAGMFEQKQQKKELGISKDVHKKRGPPVAIKPPCPVNFARNNKVTEIEPRQEPLEKKGLECGQLEERSGTTKPDLQTSTGSEKPESEKEEDEEAPNMTPADKHKGEKQDVITDQVTRETKEENESDILTEEEKLPTTDEQTELGISKDVHKKRGPPVAIKPPCPVNFARNNKVTEIEPRQEPLEKKGLECGQLEERSGTTKPDLQTSTGSEKPESEKEEDEEAPNMTPADKHKGEDVITDQVTRETKEENESDILTEEEKLPTTDEQTESEKDEEENKEAPNMATSDEHKEKKQDAITDQVTGETKEENAKKKEENDSDDLKEEEKSPTTDEQTELEKEADDKAKSDPKNDAGELVDSSNSEQVPGETNEENVGK
ncbi:chromogranin-A-like isoform X2 [Archocentrus centrarchus]|uniref:chromogranin-A-like isoform X2 n=1 Tax=Archocentrus centrarchus TaxID=63155 RepID=UPI0011EA1D18|nr:chromogranin-A-like isoform X2 [Archocentrus centrarchus]